MDFEDFHGSFTALVDKYMETGNRTFHDFLVDVHELLHIDDKQSVSQKKEKVPEVRDDEMTQSQRSFK